MTYTLINQPTFTLVSAFIFLVILVLLVAALGSILHYKIYKFANYVNALLCQRI